MKMLLVVCIGLNFLLGVSVARAYSNETEGNHWQIAGYKPNYFLVGNPESKLQLSFKVRLIEKLNLYFAYSQLMFWELDKKSAPMRDFSYNPELFYRLNLRESEKNWLDVGLYEHESNGRDQNASRSWNRFYLRYSSDFPANDEATVYWSLKAWIPWDLDNDNKDIIYHRGLWELNVTLTSFLGEAFDRNDLTLRIYPGGPSGTDPLKGGQELTLRLNQVIIRRMLPVVTIQVFNGYGESLIDYRKRYTALRVGVGF